MWHGTEGAVGVGGRKEHPHPGGKRSPGKVSSGESLEVIL